MAAADEPRTVLVHVNIEVTEDDAAGDDVRADLIEKLGLSDDASLADALADYIVSAVAIDLEACGLDRNVVIAAPLAEEI